ncbi:ABC transporter ATP-binding protein [Pseudacidovorax sp. NFM-22]|uniref:ABC transporter ATP-binding protein n=1 Tax=Pseudacidovorax sp. NFM-22 TaxID=2744469 RepID=UPI001F183330|nr:ABC transporter ATP-binding protein [Pseudacidovorax sp. NFM-22]
MTTVPPPLLDVRGLCLGVGDAGRLVVDRASFQVRTGEIVAVVGESGSGKTLAARAVLGLTPPAIRVRGGAIHIEGRDLAALKPAELRALRGRRIGMVFQEPMTSLNPALSVGRQLEEALALHTPLDAQERRAAIIAMLQRVGLADPDRVLRAWPHEFSGGMRQRIMLASVMLPRPALLVADEPTTALDAVVQRDVLELMVSLTAESGTAVLMISHDLAMVARYSHRVIVMCRGEIVEQGPTEQILRAPAHPYTRQLLGAMPRRRDVPAVDPQDAPLVEVRQLVVDFPARGGLLRRGQPQRALHGIDLALRPREVVAVVGGSGSGKTTLGRVIAHLQKPSSGELLFDGQAVRGSSGATWAAYRRDCQMVFQDPYASLDPRMTVAQSIGEALRGTGLDHETAAARVREAIEEVGLDAGHASRYPHELSGGQRQRVAIARAVVRRPRLVVADEPVSALDTTVRAQILDLFAELQHRHGFACLFISHDLAVVEQLANRVVVMNQGRIVEEGPRDQIFDRPAHPYTRRLLQAIPALEPTPDGGVRLRWRHADDTPAPAASGGACRPAD